jgi:signal transduction histidine kinase/CHASE1-domain containing sensor protein
MTIDVGEVPVGLSGPSGKSRSATSSGAGSAQVVVAGADRDSVRTFASWVWSRVRSAAALAILVALVCVGLSAGAGALVARSQHEAARQQLARRTTLVAEAVSSETGRYVDTLRIVAAATGSYVTLTASKFAQATQPLGQMRLAGATSIVFLVPATDAQRTSAQALWRSRGVPDLTFVPAGSTSQHIFSVFYLPLDGVTRPHAGLDVTQAPAPSQALNEARRTGQVAISTPYQLITDQNLPSRQRQPSFTLTAPVRGPPDARGNRPFLGWVLMGVRGQDFVGATLDRESQNLLDVTLRAQNAAGADTTVATRRAGVSGRRDLSNDVDVSVADWHWQLRVQASGHRLPGGTTNLPRLVVGVGVVVSLLLAGLVWVLATGRVRAHALVDRATRDLTAAEADARRKASLLTAILDSISDGVVVVDANGAHVLRNPAARAILGVDTELGHSPHPAAHFGVFLPDGHELVPTTELPMAQAMAGVSTDHVEMLIRNPERPNGLVITASARPMQTDDGRTGAVAVFHDITDRKAAETELRTARDTLADNQAYLTQILDAIDVAVLACDTTGTIIQANRTAHQTLTTGDGPITIADAFTRSEIRGSDGAAMTVDAIPLMRALAGEQVDGAEVTVPLPGGARRILLMDARPLHDTSGHIVGAVASSYEVTSQREREADLQAFAGVVAHDLNAPLAAIAGFVEILTEDLADGVDPVSLAATLSRVGSAVQRMRRLIEDLLSYATARDRHLNREPVDLNSLVAEVITERTAHLRITPGAIPEQFPDIVAAPLPTVDADKAMTRQLLDNLIGNAIKYTPNGEPAHIVVSAEPDSDGWTRVQIADHGIGIPTPDQPHVFTSFHRAAAHTSYTGTGLGLAICHRVINRHGGTITATDNPGGGTRIQFTLPTTTPRRPATMPPRSAHTSSR